MTGARPQPVVGAPPASRWRPSGWTRLGAPLLAAALVPGLAGCGQGLPSGTTLVHQLAASMARLSAYRITGTSQAVRTTTSFRVLVRRNGDFQGTLDIAVPRAPIFRSDVVAIGDRVYVRSPTELQELGITALPGNLNPATTWVVQPKAVALSYRQSVEPFSGAGLAQTLKRVLSGPLTVRRSQLGGVAVLVVEERGGSSLLRLFVTPTSDHLLELAITGDQPISLRYSAFGLSQAVVAPPSADVYVPPTQAAPG
ncbi:MAG TPA: hypothetical protein VNF24_11080 [Candidatus Acidoferrales bacterium]|nr:hypothetical protein [Candidatus Acidoferrales bacterium]